MTNDTSRPILAVDVDGVLNALSIGTPPAGWADTEAAGWPIRYNPSHGAALLALAAETGAELVWLTTWQRRANEHIAPLVGLPALPFVPLPADWRRQTLTRSVGQIKATALIAWAGDRPVVWLDDEPDATEILAYWPTPHHVVQVNDITGLQPEDLAEARAWLLNPGAESPERAAIRAVLARRYGPAIDPTEAMIDAVAAALRNPDDN